jgi:2-oxoglutarate ferredoxin oxidoreductase subunit gamma
VPKRVEIRIGGLGGQGVVLAGHILGRAAVNDGLQVVQTQSYGAEARGSAAKSEIIVSEEKIGYPMVRKSDILVAMSQTALDKHLNDLKEGGIIIIDTDMVKEVPSVKAKIFKVGATKTAETDLKSKMAANIVMLGAVAKITGIVTPSSVEKAIKDSFSGDTIDKNIAAFRAGLTLTGSVT